MKHLVIGKILFPLLTAGLISLGPVQYAAGEIVGTENAMQLHERSSQIDRISRTLSQQQVREQLTRLGVDPAAAIQRVAALSDSELQVLEQRLGDLPAGAGGVLEVVGIVMVVLLILELLGVTDVFKAI
jgi:hypothetical protein